MTAKATKKKAVPVVDSIAKLTHEEYHFYCVQMGYSLGALYDLTCKPGEWYEGNVGGEACRASFRLLDELQGILDERSRAERGTAEEDEKQRSISISQDDVNKYRAALAPALSFLELVRGKDLGDDGLQSQRIGYCLELFELVANQGLALMRFRLQAAGGGAQ